MSKFNQEEWKEFLNNSMPGYSRTVNRNKRSNIQEQTTSNGKEEEIPMEYKKATLESKRKDAFSVDIYKQEEQSIRKQGEIKYTEKDKAFSNKLNTNLNTSYVKVKRK